MKLFQSIWKRTTYSLGRALRETGLSLDAKGSQLTKDIAYLEPLSRHRSIMPLYDLSPIILLDCYIAPNATIIGEVIIGNESSVWYGSVIRGDLNAVRIGNNCSIGDNTVIHTASSLPTGIPASVNIGNYVNVQSNCTLYSCTIDDECLIGHNTVILEGSKVERGSVIGPNSVVPPGRLIPSHQLWAGNPVEYVRDLTKAELQSLIHTQKQNLQVALDHKYEYLPYNSAYLLKENTQDDLTPPLETLRDRGNVREEGQGDRAKQNVP